MSDFLNTDEWIALNERLKERRIKSGIPPSQEIAPANQPQADGEAQSKKEWDEWIALNKRLNERQIQSGITPSEESVISQNFSSNGEISEEPKQPRQHYEMYCPVCGEHVGIPMAAVGGKIACLHCQSEIVPVFFTKIRPKKIGSRFANLTEVTIRKTTQKGETPLHRAAKIGRICDMPKHLLTTELFMARNNTFARETPLHIAARYGHLDKIPKEFLTKETLTASTEYEKKESKTGSTPPRTETPLHTAARYGHADQIPKEFLTPEFLCIEASGYRHTVLHQLAFAKRLDLVPDIYANSEMWNLKDSQGQTPRGILESVIEREAYVARVRIEPATEKQKEKLRYFGCALQEGMTKGQASDALDKYVKEYPEKERAYYSRPATEEQMKILHAYYGKNLDEVDGPFTYGKVKDLIWQRDMEKRHQARVNEIEENSYQLVIMDFLRWRVEHYRHLTYSRVKKATRVLDESNPGWSKLDNCQDLLLEKVVELNPEWAEKEHWC